MNDYGAALVICDGEVFNAAKFLKVSSPEMLLARQ